MYTKSPWELVIGKESCFHEGNRCSIVTHVKDKDEKVYSTIAEIWATSNDTDIADARLIASAPDLLEACKRFLKSSYCQNGCKSDDMTCDTMFAKQAISKAEGK